MYPVPADYDDVFGDYMKPANGTRWKAWMFDTSRPYTEVIKEKYFYKNLLAKSGMDRNGNKIRKFFC